MNAEGNYVRLMTKKLSMYLWSIIMGLFTPFAIFIAPVGSALAGTFRFREIGKYLLVDIVLLVTYYYVFKHRTERKDKIISLILLMGSPILVVAVHLFLY